MLRALFFGTSAFAVPSLKLVAGRTSLLGVVTQPDRRAGRGQRLQQTPVKAAALERSARIYEPARLREFASEIRDLEIDCVIVASYGKIIPPELLDLPKMGSLNVHPSLLPRYRGATPIQAALLNGDRETGVTIMLMDEGMDTGDVVLQRATPISDSDDYGSLHDRLAGIGAELLGEAILQGEQHGIFPHHAQHGEASVTHPIARSDLEIDWSWHADAIVNHVRAYSPKPTARATLFGVPVKVLAARRYPAAVLPESGVDADAVLIQCDGGILAVESLIAPNHALETGAAFARRVLEK